MTEQQRHHDLALMILVGRSLPAGLPWSLDIDQQLILRERLLWTALTPEQQQTEQRFLADLWQCKGARRTVPVNPAWGAWTAKLPAAVQVPDSAFGLSTQGFRPWLKGSWAEHHQELAQVLQWLWSRGYQVAGVEVGDRTTVTLIIPVTRLIQESERLMALIGKHFGVDTLGPWGTEGKVWLRSMYDPISGQATLDVVGLLDQPRE
jgi:hypothetical protein